MSYWLAEVVSYPVETGGIWYNNAAQRAPGVRLDGWQLARRWGPHVPSDRQATTHKPIAERALESHFERRFTPFNVWAGVTFNQVVRGSNPRTLIFEKWRKILEIEIFRFFRFIYFIISRSYYE